MISIWKVIQRKTGVAAGSNDAAVKVETMQLQHQYEEVYADESISASQKLENMADQVLKWCSSEAVDPLTSDGDVMDIRAHATFNRLFKSFSETCACQTDEAADGDSAKVRMESCFWHCAQPNLHDVLYEIVVAVFAVFGDWLTCFGNLALDLCSSGHCV